MKKFGTKHTGIRYRKHESRKHGVAFDRYYYIYYRYQGKRVEEGLGWASDDMTLNKALARRTEILGLIELKKRGIHNGPITAKERKAAEFKNESDAARDLTVADFIPIYLKAAQDKGKTTWKEDKQKFNYYILNQDILPSFGNKKLREVTVSELNILVDDVRSRGAQVAANRLISLLTRFFSVAVNKGYLESSQANKLEKTPEAPRDRALSHGEIKELWEYLDSKSNKRSVPVTDLIKLLLLTGKRTGEVRQMEWSELDLKRGIWTIPRHKVKNRKKPVTVYLNTFSLAILRRRKLTATSSFVFPSQKKDAEGPMTKTVCSRFIQRSPFDFRIHDLRRTVTTLLAEMEIPPSIIDRMLGHSDGSVRSRVYDQFQYADAQTEAWEKLCWRIVRCIL